MSTLAFMYDDIAHYYDLIHTTLTEDIDHLLALVAETGGPVLELGCGTGRLLRPVARAGYQITGVDKAQPMLSRARHNLAKESREVQQRVTLVEGDIAELSLPGRESSFALAVIPYNTLMHLSPTEVPIVLGHIGRYLVPRGKLFIDVINPMIVAQSPTEGALSLEGTFADDEQNAVVLQLSSSRLDAEAQTMETTWIYDASPRGGGPVHRTLSRALYHYYLPHQIELLLTHAGFELEEMSGDYDDSPFTENSARMLLLARPVA